MMQVLNKEKKTLKNIDFSLIRYANCWEDADLLLDGLKTKTGDKVLSIGSGGDNSFSFLTTGASKVVAVDVSEVQLHLIELKKEAIRLLEREAYLKFVGFASEIEEARLATYNMLKVNLSDECIAYWDNNIAVIKSGLVHGGKFEKYFNLFAKRVLPFIHSKKKIAKLLEPKSALEQAQFFNKSWNTWRWRVFFKAFFSRFVMGRLGRDKSFLNEVEGSVSTFILSQAKKHLSSKHAQQNFMLNYSLTGDFKGQLPHYVQANNYELIKQNIDKLAAVKGFAQDAIDKHGPFDVFNLSNIFEYLDKQTFSELHTGLMAGGTKNARYAYWNLMVDRKMAELPNSELQNQANQAQTKDKGFFYKRFVVDYKMVTT